MNLPTYQSHKRVQAARIVDVDQESGILLVAEGIPGMTTPVRVPAGFFARSAPAIGDYFVRYRDGYVSHSPAKEFEDGYALAAADRALLSDEGLEKAIAATPGERVTKEYMASRIAKVDYLTLPGTTVTLCNITLDNGYSVRGESACVDPANFNREIGERIAHDNAFDKLWPLFGFLLAEARHRRGAGNPAIPADIIARTCHEVNRAICETFGDASQKPWDEAEGWQRESAMKGVEFALGSPGCTPQDQHEAWMADKRAAGWTHGPVKDAEAKTHPCMVPYDQLPPEQRVKDAAFRAVVHGLSA